MNIQPPSKQSQRALTLIDCLVVIGIIGILAGLLLPASSGSYRARIKIAKVEMANLVAAINQYEATYNHLPFADSNTNDDVTFGFGLADVIGSQRVSGTRLVATNSDLMIILMDIDRGVNAGHKFNPQKTAFISPRSVNDTKSPGVSTVDYQYRDPWGNPYVISLDANHDGQTRDAFYANPTVSSNVNSLALINTDGVYELDGKLMIWSRGPDGEADYALRANLGVNKDNVLSWRW